MKNYSLIGNNISYSLSPAIHKKLCAFFENPGLKKINYTITDIPLGRLPDYLPVLSGLDGFNVTIPFKSELLPFLSSVSETARVIGAVNTVRCESGRLSGFNTDCAGFTGALRLAGTELSGRVLLCGHGGAARAVAYEVHKNGCELTVAARESGVNRAREFARCFCEEFNTDIAVVPYDDLSGDFELIINATPCGMDGYPPLVPVPEGTLLSAHGIFDLVYLNGRETPLVSLARQNGIRSTSGMSMLVLQAAKAQELFQGLRLDKKQLLSVIESFTGNGVKND